MAEGASRKEVFYDVESTPNVFLLSLCQVGPVQRDDVYYLVDDPERVCMGDWRRVCAERVRQKNGNFANAAVYFHDLSQERAMRGLVARFGCSDAPTPVAPVSARPTPDGQAAFVDGGIPFAPCHLDEAARAGAALPARTAAAPAGAAAGPSAAGTTATGGFAGEGSATSAGLANSGASPADAEEWLFGFNSYNYDATIISWLFANTRWTGAGQGGQAYAHPTAAELRAFNDRLFTRENKGQMANALGGVDDPASRIRHNMVKCGTNVDVARLNEKQSHAGLKRLLGLLGCQILESDKVSGDSPIEDVDQLADLIAYNASDCVNLAVLFHHPFYQGQFELKLGLLRAYPQLVWWPSAGRVRSDMRASDVGDYRAFPSPTTMRGDRLTADSRSAQFAIMALCPYGHLTDIPHVDLHYPVVQVDGTTKSVDVLEMARAFFQRHIDGEGEDAQAAREQFALVHAFYSNLRGKNFNASAQYAADFGTRAESVRGLAEECRSFAREHAGVPGAGSSVFLPYYRDAQGTETDCYVVFSVGGLHGAQHAVGAERVQAPGGGEQLSLLDQLAEDGGADGLEDVLGMGAEPRGAELARGGVLDAKYAMTSAGVVWHEDFTSYYPSMLRNMKAFANPGLGTGPDGQPVDRYGQVFEQKQLYKRLMDDPATRPDQRQEYRIRREGVKLVLNSASGAGAAPFENAVRMNNRILSMRIIGQLFTWMVGQSLAWEGGRPVSTNTDGLYVAFDPVEGDEDGSVRNTRGLRAAADRTGVQIEPELCGLVSKDANNRLEFDARTREVVDPAGGTLSCAKGPDPTKALNHAAVVDAMLAQALLDAERDDPTLPKTMSHAQARAYVDAMVDAPHADAGSRARLLQMLQVVVAASPSVHNWPFATLNPDENLLVHDPTDVALQQYNRVFVVDAHAAREAGLAADVGPCHLLAASCRADAKGGSQRSTWVHRQAEPGYDPVADDKAFAVQKITGIRPEWWVVVVNGSLWHMPRAQADALIASVDRDVYADMLAHAFNANWSNAGKVLREHDRSAK